ncbi:MAG: GNAT family acetyltransferase [Chthoniobacterales bacterium]
MNSEPEVKIRPYEPRDREVVRRLCCETGFLGKAIDVVFEDRELFADYLTTYYTDFEPESCFVMEVDGVIKGYLLGSRKPLWHQTYSFFHNILLFFKGMKRYPRYSKISRDFVGWVLRNSWKEVPASPRRCAHFHINILPEAQGVPTTFVMLQAYFKHLKKFGEKTVYAQMVTFESRRGAKVLERFGFNVINRSEITKYRKIHPEPVYLTTIIKDLEKPERYSLPTNRAFAAMG